MSEDASSMHSVMLGQKPLPNHCPAQLVDKPCSVAALQFARHMPLGSPGQYRYSSSTWPEVDVESWICRSDKPCAQSRGLMVNFGHLQSQNIHRPATTMPRAAFAGHCPHSAMRRAISCQAVDARNKTRGKCWRKEYIATSILMKMLSIAITVIISS